VELKLHAFLKATLHGCELSPSLPGYICLGGKEQTGQLASKLCGLQRESEHGTGREEGSVRGHVQRASKA